MSVAARALETPKSPRVAAREQVAVQGLELADGVGDGEQPAGRGGHRGAPCRLHPLRRVRGGTMSGAHAVREVSRWSSKTQDPGGAWGVGCIKGVMGRRDTATDPAPSPGTADQSLQSTGAGAQRRPIIASRAVAGRAGHPGGRSGGPAAPWTRGVYLGLLGWSVTRSRQFPVHPRARGGRVSPRAPLDHPCLAPQPAPRLSRRPQPVGSVTILAGA